MGWVSPTGGNGPHDNVPYAYDDLLDTRAAWKSTGGAAPEWSPWLELTHAAINCDKIRFNVYRQTYTLLTKVEVYYDGNYHEIYNDDIHPDHDWHEVLLGVTKSVTKARISTYITVSEYDCWIWEFDFNEAIAAPTVTTQPATDVQTTTATGNGNITNTGGENCDIRGIVWDLASHGDPGNVAPGASGYANDVAETDSFGTGPFTRSLTGLPTGDIIYCRAYAHNSAGYSYGAEVNFLTKPAAPTNCQATDGDHTDKVVITWIKSTGATGYQVYRDDAPLGWLGDVNTYDDNGADAPTITPGTADASDGLFSTHVELNLAGESGNPGTVHTYKVRAKNATGESVDSGTNTGYRGVGDLTYQWERSAGDSDDTYGDIIGATTDPYDDVGAPANGQGRYYRCVLNAAGAAEQTSSSDRGYRAISDKTAHMAAKLLSAGEII